MKYISILLIALIFISCNDKKEDVPLNLMPHVAPIGVDSLVYPYSSTIVRAFKNSGNWDSVYLYSDGHLVITEQSIKKRYFLISYNYRGKNNYDEGEGNLTYTSNGFPTKGELDSTIFGGLPKQRKCYQHIIITSIFEFSGVSDFYSFSNGLNGDSPKKDKKICK